MKTYKNISNAPVLGNPPGKVFEVDPEKVSADQLKRMAARKSIEEVDKSELPSEVPAEESEEEQAEDEPGSETDAEDDGDDSQTGKPKAQVTPPPKAPPSGRKV
jgi:hypothetical protein